MSNKIFYLMFALLLIGGIDVAYAQENAFEAIGEIFETMFGFTDTAGTFFVVGLVVLGISGAVAVATESIELTFLVGLLTLVLFSFTGVLPQWIGIALIISAGAVITLLIAGVIR